MRHSFRALAAAATLAALSMGTAQAQSATYVLDPTHTFVTFEIGHFGTSTNRGRFDKKEGTVQFDRAGKTGKVDLTIDATSISTGTPLFDKHLQSADLFNVAKFPTMQFSADQFRFNGDKVSEIGGKLTMLGQTHPVTLKANNFNCYQSPMLKREVCGGDFSATIDRTQWGLDYGMGMVAGKEVKLIATVEAVRQ